MVNWHHFIPIDFEYDSESDKLAKHDVTFEETVECFSPESEIRHDKSYHRIITGWQI